MNIPNITGIVKVGKTFLLANRPEILLGAALTATIGSAVLAAKGGYQARGIIDDAEADRVDQTVPLSVKEKIQLTWLCYMPAAIACTTAVGSIGGLHLVHVKEKKALATAGLAALEELKTEFREYEKQNIGVVSSEEKDKILEGREDAQGFAHVQNSDHELEELYLIRDGRTGRDIWSNQRRIDEAVIEVNNVLQGSGDVELNHFYRHAGFNNIPDGHNYGWNKGALVEVVWAETKRDDGRPVREFRFRPAPEDGFDSAN